MKRITGIYGDDLVKGFASEDGKHYRTFHQRAEPLFKHVNHLNDKVNTAPASGNRNGWKYAGSVPISVVTDWCHRHGVPFDVWARNEGGMKDRFMEYFRSEFSKLMPKQGASARPSIAVPTTYTPRKNAQLEGAPDGTGPDH